MTVKQFFDTDSALVVDGARSIAQGFHRWGLLEYTHHPIGTSYLALPLVWLGFDWYFLVPLGASALAAGFALWVLLRYSSSRAMQAYVCFLFLSLLWQPGFVEWVGNYCDFSYNMSSVFALLAIAAVARRVSLLFAFIGFICGWIGYDFFSLQVFAIIAMRIAFWGRRRGTPLRYAVYAAAAEGSAFAAAFLTSWFLHYVQDVLYFSSADMAFHDLYGSLGFRVDMRWDQRFATASQLLTQYIHVFLGAGTWSNPRLLAALGGAYVVATVAAARHWVRQNWAYGASAANAKMIARGLVLYAACLACACASLYVWFAAAPREAAPHLFWFPRMLFVPPIILSFCTVILFSMAPRDPYPRRWVSHTVAYLVLLLVVATDLILPDATRAAIDDHFFHTIWATPTAAVRTDRLKSPWLPSVASASSVAPSFSVAGPVTWKQHVMLVGDIGFWGAQLDNAPDLRWSPEPSAPLPAVYDQRFPGSVDVTDIALRFWGLPKGRGKYTPAQFQLDALRAADAAPDVLRRYPADPGEVTQQGKYLCLHYQFSPPVECEGLRIRISSTVGGGVPVMTDFLAFGVPHTGAAPTHPK